MNAAHRYVLSSTPIENRPTELWSIFDFLMKAHLGSYRGFVSQIEKPIINGDQEKTDYLAKRISPFILRRLKEE
jgi:SNF2 family DNA or RNA helicase